MHVLVELIGDALHRLFERANDAGVLRDEGDWTFPVMHTDDVLRELCWLGEVADEVVDDVVELFDPDDWVHAHEPFERPPDYPLREGWQRFCEYVKHQSRYMLKTVEPDGSEGWESWYSPTEMPDVLTSMMQDWLRVLPEGTTVYRARAVDNPPKRDLRVPQDYTSPPESRAGQGRMNAAGISMFYGAFEPDTAATEVYGRLPRSNVLRFVTTKSLRIVDLTGENDPSPFDPGVNHMKLGVARFLEGFVADVAKPIVHDDRIHREYIPTQVFTEYLRYKLLPNSTEELDGLVFPSSVRHGGTNIVIFGGVTACLSDLELDGRRRSELQMLGWAGEDPVEYRFDPPRAHVVE